MGRIRTWLHRFCNHNEAELVVLLLTTLVGFNFSTYLSTRELDSKTQRLMENQQRDTQLLTVMVQDVRTAGVGYAAKIDEHEKTLTSHGERIGKAEVRLDLLRAEK